MDIKKAAPEELPQILKIYADARGFMRENGNPDQWGDAYPPKSLIQADIGAGRCHVCLDGGEIVGVFYFAKENDPTYARIYEGEWLNDRPYAVIHRIAVAKHRRGVASCCFDYCFSQCANLKIDTHRNNLPMQHSLARNGFVRCGIIYLENGEERIAYQKA